MQTWQVLESRYVFKSLFVSIRSDRCRMPDGRIVPEFYLVERDDYVMVVPITPRGELVLVRQYKHGAGGVIFELPAGYLFPGEEAAASGARELAEETGYRAPELLSLGSLAAVPGFMSTRAHFFLARNVERTSGQHLDEFEDIEVHLFPFADILAQVRRGDTSVLGDLSSIAAVLLADAALQRAG